MKTILIVEDERIVARDLQAMLEQFGYSVAAIAANGADAIAKAKGLQPDLVLMDVRLQGTIDGIEAASLILSQLDIPVIYLTAFTDEATRQRARQTAPYGYLVKPFDERSVQTTIEMALERHARDRQSATQKQWLSGALANLADAVVTTDASGKVTFINSAAERLLQCSKADILGVSVASTATFLDPLTRAEIEHPVIAALRQHTPVHLKDQAILVAPNGAEVAISGSVAPFQLADQGAHGAVLVFQAYSLQQRSRASRTASVQDDDQRQIQRLRVLAGGIAHDLNNIMAAVLGNAEMARLDLPDEHLASESLGKIAQSVERATKLTRQLRAYAGEAPMLLEPLDLTLLVRQAVAALQSSALAQATIHLYLAPDLPLIEADSAQLQQAVQQVLTNAAEAVQATAGSIIITTELRQISGAEIANAIIGAGLPPGSYAAIEIADTGPGIDQATLPQIFDPFFTTKFTGRGLGLPAVLGIIQQHHGAILVQSTPQQGSAFTILLPTRSQ